MSVETMRKPVASGSDVDIEFLAGLLDDRFQIPGTNIRFGVDAVIGLIPGVGDAISATLSSYLIWRAHQLGASKFTLLRMAGNMAVDTVVGSVPLLGDILDVKFRANRRNLELLRRQKLKELPRQPRAFRRFP
jgi:hypothetical protein